MITTRLNIKRKDKVKIAILLFLWVLVFSPLCPELASDWLSHSDNSHGFMVPVIAGFFFWQRRDQLMTATISSSQMGGVFLFIVMVTYIVSFAGSIAFLSRLAMVLSLLGLIWFCLGEEVAIIYSFPVLFLLFMIPVPYSLISTVSLPLQFMVTRVSANIIEACSIPVYREGNMLYFINTQLEIAEACSGIRSIMALTMLAVMFASMLKDGWKMRTLMVASAIPIAILANIVRVAGTGILAHFFGGKVARGFLHEFSGVAVFMFGFIVLMAVFRYINRGISVDVK